MIVDVPRPAAMAKLTFLTCDPGKHDSALALFAGGALKALHYGTVAFSSLDSFDLLNIDMAFVELPQVYAAAGQKGDPNDLIQVAYAAGKVANRMELLSVPCVTLAPREWKGTINADIMTDRIVSKVTPEEARVVEAYRVTQRIPAGKMHNIYDAIGIGLHLLGRLNRKA